MHLYQINLAVFARCPFFATLWGLQGASDVLYEVHTHVDRTSVPASTGRRVDRGGLGLEGVREQILSWPSPSAPSSFKNTATQPFGAQARGGVIRGYGEGTQCIHLPQALCS